MKRFAAILTALAVVIIPCLIIFICGGGAPASTDATSTAAQNTTENTKTESTTSGTEAPGVQKPEFLHPAIEEINEGTDKILSLESISYDITANVSLYSPEGVLASSALYSQSVSAKNIQSEAPVFLSETVTSLSQSSQVNREKIYSDGESYYISKLGVNAKIPKNGAENIASPKELLSALLKKVLSAEKVEKSSIEKDRNIHSISISAKKAELIFPELFKALRKKAEAIAGESIVINLKKCTLNVTLDTDGYITGHSVWVAVAVFAENTNGEKSEYQLEASVIASIQRTEEAHEPKAPENIGSFVPMDSQKDLPLVMLKLAADKNNELGIFSSREHFYARKKELSGSYTDIEAFLDKAYTHSEKTEWFESISLGIAGGASPETHEFYFRDGIYYFHENGETKSYGAEAFKSAFGFSENGMPKLSLSSKEITAHDIYEAGEKIHISVSLTDEALREKFAEHIGKSARFVAYAHEIWNVSASGGKLEVLIGESGYIEEYTVTYSVRVITNINGSKFAFSSTVQSKTQFLSLGENVEVTAPEWFESENDTIQ